MKKFTHIKNQFHKTVLPLFFLTIGFFTQGQIVDITQWTFEESPLLISDATPGPTTGSGSASVVGSMGSPARGTGSNTDCSQASGTGAWQIGDANPGTVNESSGVQFMVSTVGFENIIFEYDHRFSGAATRTARIQYTLDGSNWLNFDVTASNYSNSCNNRGAIDLGRIDVTDPIGGGGGNSWSRRTIDFSSVTGANDNSNFGVRIVAAHYQTTGEFRQSSDASSDNVSGTWRFDNVTFSGEVIPGVPALIASNLLLTGFNYIINNGPSSEQSFELTGSDLVGSGNFTLTAPSDYEVSLTSGSGFGTSVSIPFASGVLTSQPVSIFVRLKSGLPNGTYNQVITISSDGGITNPPEINVEGFVSATLLPDVFDLSSGNFSFDQWDEINPAFTYPANMRFWRTNSILETPTTSDPDGNYEGAYSLTSASRISGQDANGVSFVATGSTGAGIPFGAVVGLNTTGRVNIEVSWLARMISQATGSPTPREFRLRMQYRVGDSGPWTDVPGPVEYTSDGKTNSSSESFGPTVLPAVCENEPEVYVRWIYFQEEENSGGNRPEIGLDDISITSDAFVAPTTYYYRGTGAINSTSNWTTEPSGIGGTEPTDFSTVNQTFEIRNTGSVTLSAPWNITGGGSKVVLGNGTDPITFTVSADFTAPLVDVEDQATYVISNEVFPDFGIINTGSTVRFTGSSSLTLNVPAATYGTLELHGDATKNLPNADFTIEGDFEMAGNINTNADFFRTITFNGETLRLLAGANMQPGNGFDNTTHRNTNITFNTTTNQFINCQNATDTLRIGRLISEKSSGSLTLQGNVSLYNRLMLNYTGTANFSDGGNYILNGGNIEVAGDAARYNLSGTIEMRRLDGDAGNHNIREIEGNNGAPAVCEFNNLILRSPNDINFRPTNSNVANYTIKGILTVENTAGVIDLGRNNIITVQGDVNVHSGKDLPVNRGGSLVVEGTLINNGTITLIAQGKDDYARLISDASSGSGTISQQMRLTPGTSFKWYAMGAPTTGVMVQSIGGGLFTNTSVYSWHAVDGWDAAHTATFERGKGLLIAAGENNPHGFFTVTANDENIAFTGVNPNNSSDVIITNMDFGAAPTGVTFTTSEEQGWNLLANPYHADFDLNNLVADNTSTQKALYIRTETGYQAYIPADNDPVEAQFLSPGEGFFVRADAAGRNFTFDRSRRTTGGGDGLLRPTTIRDRVLVEARRDSVVADATIINFRDGATTNFDGMYDAHKFENVDNYPSFYTEIGTHTYAINSLPLLTGSYSLPAGFKTSTAGNYTISLANLQDMNPLIQVTLEDKRENTFTDLRIEDYTFNHLPNNAADRFILHFDYNAVSVQNFNNIQTLRAWVYQSEVYLHASKDLGSANIEVVDLTGKVVYQTNTFINKGEMQIGLPTTLSKGVYILRVSSSTENKIVKFSF